MHRLLVYKSKAYDIFLEAEDKFPSYEVTPRHGNLSKQPSDEGGNGEYFKNKIHLVYMI